MKESEDPQRETRIKDERRRLDVNQRREAMEQLRSDARGNVAVRIGGKRQAFVERQMVDVRIDVGGGGEGPKLR